jgi:hypothetical protein
MITITRPVSRVVTLQIPGIQGIPGSATVGAGLDVGTADARYVQLTSIGVAGGVPALDTNALLLQVNVPEPLVDLTILFENQIA